VECCGSGGQRLLTTLQGRRGSRGLHFELLQRSTALEGQKNGLSRRSFVEEMKEIIVCGYGPTINFPDEISRRETHPAKTVGIRAGVYAPTPVRGATARGNNHVQKDRALFAPRRFCVLGNVPSGVDCAFPFRRFAPVKRLTDADCDIPFSLFRGIPSSTKSVLSFISHRDISEVYIAARRFC
jgi:hypothetical protein